MPQSYQEHNGDNSTHTYTIAFGSGTTKYLKREHIKLYYGRDRVAGTQTDTLTLDTDYVYVSEFVIKLIGSTLNTGVTVGDPYPLASGRKLTIERDTPQDSLLVPWADGSQLTKEALETSNLQVLFAQQEEADSGLLNSTEARAATTASDTATANVTALTASKVSKDGSIAMTGNLQLGTNRITGVGNPSGNQDAATKLYVDLKPGATGEFNNTPISLNDDTKIGFGNTAASPDATIDWDTDGWFDRLEIRSTRSTWSYVANGERHLFLVDNASVLAINETYIDVYADIKPNAHGNVDLGASNKKWKDLYVDGTGYIDTVSADDITGAAIVTSGTSTSDTKVYSAKRCDELYYNLASAEEIQSGETWVGADNKVATTAAIDARIVDLIDDVGGFIPLANELSFPNANPDPNNNAGTLLSVPLTNSYTANAGGQIIIANGTVGNSTVTIINAEANETYTAGFGLIVETQSLGDTTYKFHRYVPKATEVTTVAGNIANVNTVAGISSNVTTVAGISGNVTTVAGDTTNINTCATNISSITGASTQATNAASSATAAASSATAAASSATTASTQATNSASSATASAASASTASTQATNSATSATASAASEANALAYRNTTETYKIAAQGFRDTTSGIYTQAESGPYNLADNVSSHTAWGDITDTGANAVFENETSNILLTMSEGSSSYDYGAVA